ncbi:hypothetical protein [uncultured Clostridium sp.]|uniref:hypothetical protein n=1 Tax=uncultured Clostridium sp. TaxID=59620 RepID=UPI0026247F89|nr:hypothetical protein [uncultured Clostridium sp.]
MKKKRVNSYVSPENYEFLVREKERTGENLSVVVDRIISEYQTQSDEFMENLADLLFEKLNPHLRQLRTIGNETNVVVRTNKEILNYLLLSENHIKDFASNGKDKEHLVTMQSADKIRSQINHQRLINLENQNLKRDK